MDAKQPISISAESLYRVLGTAAAPLILDVRRAHAFDADDRLIVGAIRRDPATLQSWQSGLPTGRLIVVYCAHGQRVGQAVAAALRDAGHDARFLAGGIAGWTAQGLPTRRKIGPPPQSWAPGKWVTRERPTIDRIACPWLISRFIDPEAEFIYVPADTVREAASRLGATPYDIPGVEFGHHGELCSFDAVIGVYGIRDGALDRLALIVRGADTSHPELTPQSPGLLAISQGLKVNFTDDHAMLAHGMVVYDALYAWCRAQTPAPTPAS
jgi:rhodanese-related sulfurtransferase